MDPIGLIINYSIVRSVVQILDLARNEVDTNAVKVAGSKHRQEHLNIRTFREKAYLKYKKLGDQYSVNQQYINIPYPLLSSMPVFHFLY